jgi:DhnA family fructose-bisphosphate aldolase class Ia
MAAQDGRSLIVGFDHGIGGANYAGMASPGQTLDEVISAGADAVLTTIGMAEAFGSKLNRPPVRLTSEADAT